MDGDLDAHGYVSNILILMGGFLSTFITAILTVQPMLLSILRYSYRHKCNYKYRYHYGALRCLQGIVFARFSRPKARILFTSHVVWPFSRSLPRTTYEGVSALVPLSRPYLQLAKNNAHVFADHCALQRTAVTYVPCGKLARDPRYGAPGKCASEHQSVSVSVPVTRLRLVYFSSSQRFWQKEPHICACTM